MPARGYMEENSWGAKRLAGVAPEVNLREYITHMLPPSVNKVAHSGQRRHHQKSKIVVSVVPQKGLTSSKNFRKKISVAAIIRNNSNIIKTYVFIIIPAQLVS